MVTGWRFCLLQSDILLSSWTYTFFYGLSTIVTSFILKTITHAIRNADFIVTIFTIFTLFTFLCFYVISLYVFLYITALCLSDQRFVLNLHVKYRSFHYILIMFEKLKDVLQKFNIKLIAIILILLRFWVTILTKSQITQKAGIYLIPFTLSNYDTNCLHRDNKTWLLKKFKTALQRYFAVKIVYRTSMILLL